jgi:hypothetical protein
MESETWIDPDELGVPWVDPAIQERVRWRDGDIVISVPVKSGTTSTMNIVHQLRSGGDADLKDVYLEVPWLELLPGPTTTADDILQKIDEVLATISSRPGGRCAISQMCC